MWLLHDLDRFKQTVLVLTNSCFCQWHQWKVQF